MKLKSFCLLLIFYVQFLWSQDGFNFDSPKNKIILPFEFINNLIIIPIEVNGVSLNFLLDTGVEETILFSIDETDEINFAKIEKIRIRGFGSNDAFDGYKSVNNKLSIKNYTDINHTVYLVLDQNINISSQVGIPVNGIIGYHFFKNNLIKINYQNKRITIYKNNEKQLSKITKSYQKNPLEIINGKPYITTNAIFEKNTNPISTKLLIDTGNTDAFWYFKENNQQIVLPKINFEDYLGKGFSGEVFGKRAKIISVAIGNYAMDAPLVAFPDSIATDYIDEIQGRLGSVGSEVIRRFTVILDYKSRDIYLKKNNYFDNPFSFNMSGIEIQHQGLQWVSESYEDHPVTSNNLFDKSGDKIAGNLKYKFELKPIFVISNVRKESPADLVGLKKQDIIITINDIPGYSFTLQKINELLKSDEGKIIEFEVERNGKILKFKFQLESLL
jgi:hypothetical protein